MTKQSKLIIGACVMALLSLASYASAREITSGAAGGATGGTTTCSRVQSLTAKGDYRVGELGTSSVSTSYSVKPCAATEVLTVDTQVYEWSSTSIIYDNPFANLNDKFTVFGRLYGLYTVRINVIDADGSVIETKSTTVSVVPKRI